MIDRSGIETDLGGFQRPPVRPPARGDRAGTSPARARELSAALAASTRRMPDQRSAGLLANAAGTCAMTWISTKPVGASSAVVPTAVHAG